MSDHRALDRRLVLELVRATEAAAIASSQEMGRGDERRADTAASLAMRQALDSVAFAGNVVVGEDGDDEAPVLRDGERVGSGEGPGVDLVVDPLEGSTLCAKGGPNALSVVAAGVPGGFLRMPDMYMEKIAVGPGLPPDIIDLDASPERNIKAVAEARQTDAADLVVCVLDRPRHGAVIAQIREAGARVMLINDGDVAGIIATTRPGSGLDMYMGIGGAREGVLAAAALRGLGGQMHARLRPRDDGDRLRAQEAGIADIDRIYRVEDMAPAEILFAATGVTPGPVLRGVRRVPGGAVTHSMVMRGDSGTVRLIETHHDFARRAGFDPAAL